MDKKGCTSFDEFTQAIIQELTNLRKPLLVNLVKSISKRMSDVIASDGGKTKY